MKSSARRHPCRSSYGAFGANRNLERTKLFALSFTLSLSHCGGHRLAHGQLSYGWDWLSVTSTHFSMSKRIAEISWRFRCVKLLALLRHAPATGLSLCSPPATPLPRSPLPASHGCHVFALLAKLHCHVEANRQRCMPLVWLGHPSVGPYVPQPAAVAALAAAVGGNFWALQWLVDNGQTDSGSVGSLHAACQCADSGIDLMLFCAPATGGVAQTLLLIGPALAVFIHALRLSAFFAPNKTF